MSDQHSLRLSPIDCAKGKIINRKCDVIYNKLCITNHAKWAGLSSVIKLETCVTHKKKGETKCDVRYFISNSKFSAEKYSHIIKAHWGVENGLHRPLDVDLNEDRDTKRKGHMAENFSRIRRMAIALLNQDRYKENKIVSTIKQLILKCGMNQLYLKSVIDKFIIK